MEEVRRERGGYSPVSLRGDSHVGKFYREKMYRENKLAGHRNIATFAAGRAASYSTTSCHTKMSLPWHATPTSYTTETGKDIPVWPELFILNTTASARDLGKIIQTLSAETYPRPKLKIEIRIVDLHTETLESRDNAYRYSI